MFLRSSSRMEVSSAKAMCPLNPRDPLVSYVAIPLECCSQIRHPVAADDTTVSALLRSEGGKIDIDGSLSIHSTESGASSLFLHHTIMNVYQSVTVVGGAAGSTLNLQGSPSNIVIGGALQVNSVNPNIQNKAGSRPRLYQ